jgi:NAD(P)-dependent dehydrogenase (short-subunit alcohol dehydrogenase family)
MNGTFDVSGRVVIVTGGAGLLGREYGRVLVDAGAHVVLADVADDAVARIAATLDRRPGHCVGAGVDVADEVSVANLVRFAIERFGRIDGLVNNAALDPKMDRARAPRLGFSFEQYPLELWNRSLAVNLTGMFLCAREVAPAMLARRQGVIVNVSSTYGLVGPDQRLYESDDPGAPREYKPIDYCVTKSAAAGFTRYLATYFAGTGIRVNTLTPGGVRNEQPDDFVRRYAARTPMGRMAERHEYCGALLFLLSDASSYMTGSNLVVDGGWTAW